MATIFLLLHDEAHRTPLHERLAPHHRLIDGTVLSPVDEFDLCIADLPAFAANVGSLRASKTARAPLLTPLLVLVRDADIGSLAPHFGILVDEVLVLGNRSWNSTRPDLELRARLAQLLLTRDLSTRVNHDISAQATRQGAAVEKRKFDGSSGHDTVHDTRIARTRAAHKLWRSRDSDAALALQARRAQAMLELPPAAERMSEREFIQLGQKLLEDLTSSAIAFISTVESDAQAPMSLTWSRRTEQACCSPVARQVCEIPHAGMWAEALRRKAPVVIDDYACEVGRRPLPDGHIPLKRLLFAPVIEDETVAMLAGVGNKKTAYTVLDIETVQLISDLIWRTVQRRRALQALRDSEERYRMLAEASDDAIWLYNIASDTLTYISPSIERQSGYTADEAIARGLDGMLTPESCQKTRSLIAATVEAFAAGDTSGRIQRHELRLFHRRGGDVPIEIVATVITDADGRPTHVQGISRDIRVRKEAEQALRKSNALLRSVLESVPVRVFWKDRESRYLGCNAAFARDAGCTSPREVLGRTDFELVWKGHAALYRSDDHQVISSGIPKLDYEEPQTTPEGRSAWLRTSKVPLRDERGDVVGVLGVYQDITESKRIHDEVRKLAQAVEQSAESIVITNVNAEIEYVNETFVRLTGYTRDEVVGRNPRVLRSGKTPRGTYQAMWAALTDGRAWKGEFHNRRKDHTEFVEFALISPIRQEDGRITHYVAVKEDITEKRRVAAELDRHRFHLEELIEQRTLELKNAKAAAEAATVAKSAFIANMSHEIRTPLNAIIGLAHLMRRAGVAPHQVEQLDKIDRSARHLLRLINDILDFSKIEAGKLQLEEMDFSPAAILGNVVSLASEQAREKQIDLVTDAGPLPELGRGDPTRLTQALLNLVSNAIKFTDHGSVTVRAQQMARQRGEGTLLRFEVQDTGVGISPEAQGRLFLPFEQADPSITRKHGGTGLGLAITRRYAELMGGSVEAQSTPGQGSTFVLTVCLPPGHGRGVERAVAQREAEHTLARAYRGARVLLVEDDPINQEVALDLLQSVGLVPDLAEDGGEAVARFQAASGDYSAILMDVRMPLMDGTEATRQIRALPGGADIPIVAMTANAFAEDRSQCIASGMNDFIAKPVDPDVLFATLLKWVGRPGPVGQPATAPEPPSEADTAAPDLLEGLAGLRELDTEAGLRCMRGNVRSYVRLLRHYAHTHGLDAGRLRERTEAGDFAEARRIAHSLKGASASLGVIEIQSLAAKLESAVLKRDSAAITTLEETLAAKLSQICATLSAALPPDTLVLTEEVDWPKVHTILAQLAELLAKGDMGANTLFDAAAPMLRSALGQRAHELQGLLGDFEYEQALALLPKIRAESPVSHPGNAAG